MSRVLLCEGLECPVGIDTAGPELTWRIQGEWSAQRCWRVQVRRRDRDDVVYDSGVREGMQQSVVLPDCLQEDGWYVWQLQWELADGTRGAQRSFFSTGMFSQDHWNAAFITGGTLLRKEFIPAGAIRSAVLFYTGLGYCEAYINGRKVSDAVLSPSYTVYEKTVEYTAADVTGLLDAGKNAFGMMLAGHWPLDEEQRACNVYSAAFYRGRCTGILELHVEYEDGTQERFVTDRSWRVSDSPVVCSGIFDGEQYDARLEQPGWCCPGFDDSGWRHAVLAREPLGTLRYSYLPPIRVTGELAPQKLWRQDGHWIADFGQNFSGWVRLSLNEDAGTEVTLRHAELLYGDGSLNTENLRFAKAMDQYICRGGGEVWEPRFTYHGFRYAEISGVTGELRPEQVRGRIVHTDNAQAVHFSCSKKEFMQIHQAMLWTMRSNMHSIPTDCCQRDERQGWIADAGVCSEFGIQSFRLGSFYRKWLRDIRDTQDADGNLPMAGAPGWPRDTFVWKIGYHMTLRSLYLYTGDRRVVAENFGALARYENWLRGTLVNGLLADDFYNDWLALEFADRRMIANALLADFYEALILFASVLEDTERERQYEERLAKLKAAINREFYGNCLDNPLGTGYYGTCDTMAAAPGALALAFDIVPEEKREKVIRELLFRIREARGSVQYPTGLITTGILNQCLSDLGYDETVYEFFCRREYPSYGFMLSKGATTIWEHWQYLIHNEMNSHSHPAMCAPGVWFVKGLCGLRRVMPRREGGAVLELAPFIPEDMTYASASLETVWGVIVLDWKRTADGVRYRMELPGAVTARLRCGGRETVYGGGVHEVWL